MFRRTSAAAVLGLVAASAAAAGATPLAAVGSAADRAHAQALSLLAEGRPSAAYGRLIELANGGHAASARLSLTMCLHGPELWGRDWDCSEDDVARWAQAAGVAAPTLAPRSYRPDGRPRLRAAAPMTADRPHGRPGGSTGAGSPDRTP
ncbi:MAG TPA: hypothetical protein PKO45_14665 [Rubrivivax sp.]|nr:hypothetical protein [Rubrivivax sp.]